MKSNLVDARVISSPVWLYHNITLLWWRCPLPPPHPLRINKIHKLTREMVHFCWGILFEHTWCSCILHICNKIKHWTMISFKKVTRIHNGEEFWVIVFTIFSQIFFLISFSSLYMHLYIWHSLLFMYVWPDALSTLSSFPSGHFRYRRKQRVQQDCTWVGWRSLPRDYQLHCCLEEIRRVS